MEPATRCTAAGQLFGLSYYKAGQLQALCWPLRKIRSLAPPTLDPALAISYLSANGLKPWAMVLLPPSGRKKRRLNSMLTRDEAGFSRFRSKSLSFV